MAASDDGAFADFNNHYGKVIGVAHYLLTRIHDSEKRCTYLADKINNHLKQNRRVSMRLETVVNENEYLKQDSAAV